MKRRRKLKIDRFLRAAMGVINWHGPLQAGQNFMDRPPIRCSSWMQAMQNVLRQRVHS